MPVEFLLLVVGLMLAAVVLVGVGDRLGLPWPALMVVLGVAVTFAGGDLVNNLQLDPDLILPLFLPPLLFATAQRTSWAMFRVRWRSIASLAVALVVVTVVAVAGTAVAVVPGIALTSAVALGAMVAPPDPVAVEAVAGSVHIPRRVLIVLQSEGLFNDAVALVIFQAAVFATMQGSQLSVLSLLAQFVLGIAAAVVLGLLVARVSRWVTDRVTDATGRCALTLVLPFGVYLAAEAVSASGVIAVVVAALHMRKHSNVDEAEERLTQRSFWEVIELLVTGLAFGLIGLELRPAIDAAAAGMVYTVGQAVVVGAAVFAVRALWVTAVWLRLRTSPDVSAAPRTAREAVVVTWCGMRGLATVALALSLPRTTVEGLPFPYRDQVIVIASTVLVATLLVPGFTLPAVVRALGVSEDAEAEHAAERVVAQRAQQAALDRLTAEQRANDVPDDVSATLDDQMTQLGAALGHDDSEPDVDRSRPQTLDERRTTTRRIQSAALSAARAEVLAARGDPDVDPEAADRVLHRLDLHTVLLH